MKTITKPIAACDVPNGNGRVYSKYVWEKALADFQSKLAKGEVLGTMQSGEYSPDALDRCPDEPTAAFRVKSINIDDAKFVQATVDILDTEAGRLLLEVMETTAMEFRPSGNGEIDKDGKVSNYELLSIHAFPADHAAALTHPGSAADDPLL